MLLFPKSCLVLPFPSIGWMDYVILHPFQQYFSYTHDFTSFSTVFQLYHDDGRVIMKGYVQ